jgi:hypothetical protein
MVDWFPAGNRNSLAEITIHAAGFDETPIPVWVMP